MRIEFANKVLYVVLAAGTLVLPSCGGKPGEGALQGKVTLGGKPLTGRGIVTLVKLDDAGKLVRSATVAGKIEEGNYRVPNVSAGKYAVGFILEAPGYDDDSAVTDLTVEMTGKNQTLDLEVPPARSAQPQKKR